MPTPRFLPLTDIAEFSPLPTDQKRKALENLRSENPTALVRTSPFARARLNCSGWQRHCSEQYAGRHWSK